MECKFQTCTAEHMACWTDTECRGMMAGTVADLSSMGAPSQALAQAVETCEQASGRRRAQSSGHGLSCERAYTQDPSTWVQYDYHSLTGCITGDDCQDHGSQGAPRPPASLRAARAAASKRPSRGNGTSRRAPHRRRLRVTGRPRGSGSRLRCGARRRSVLSCWRSRRASGRTRARAPPW